MLNLNTGKGLWKPSKNSILSLHFQNSFLIVAMMQLNNLQDPSD